MSPKKAVPVAAYTAGQTDLHYLQPSDKAAALPPPSRQASSEDTEIHCMYCNSTVRVGTPCKNKKNHWH